METRECAGLCTDQGLAAAHAAYHARLLARARRIVVDHDLAEDVVQEAFLRAWRACESFDPAAGPMVNWLIVITARTAIDMVKARVRRPPLASVPADANAPADGLSDIDRLILRSELRDALSSIDALHRDAVVADTHNDLILLVDHFNASNSFVGAMMAVSSATMIVAYLIWGRMIDRG